MKKIRWVISIPVFSFLVASVVLACSLAGCGLGSGQAALGGQNGQASGSIRKTPTGDGVRIVTTIFPEYDWVREILGDNPGNAEVTMLLDNGVDLHSYQPTAADILKIATCDLFIYVGGESDEWVEDALEEATNQEMVVINLLETLGDRAKEEEIVEGMETEGEHDHADEERADGGQINGDRADVDRDHDAEEVEYDEHVWLSLRNTSLLCDAITDALVQKDAANADIYKANLERYKERLSALDAEYQSAVTAGAKKTVLFGDRFPFRYLTEDYGLSYYAAFVGCSAETEASFETIVFLANKADELGLSAIMKIENSDGRIAETIRNNTAKKNQQILTLDSMQSATSQDVAKGTTYLGIMENNLKVLKEALQ
ncbi:MAG: zinc ABC transporter substrate-binding protein [Lachnospiraceae bacterium]|nr:zinc ABC transporter substrate-binding protein [Lachnospiraceae bacterium]